MTKSGLDYDSFPMRLWEKAKKYGIWNPSDIDFSQDKVDWNKLTENEKRLVLQLTIPFQGIEEAVTLDLLPLLMIVAKQGRVEEEMFLSSFLWEESKHINAFDLFFKEVVGEVENKESFLTPAFVEIFHEILPSTMNTLLVDDSARAIAKASVTYNIMVEGILAETGYSMLFNILSKENILPGLFFLTHKLKQDESRHVAYGIFLLSRLLKEGVDGELAPVIEAQMELLMQLILGHMDEISTRFTTLPFGLTKEQFTEHAMSKLEQKRKLILRSIN